MRTNERLANLRAASMEGDIDFVNIEVKYHLESQSKKYYYQSNSFFK